MTETRYPVKNRTMEYLVQRQRAYRSTYNPKDRADLVVLKDLAKFCRANESTFHEDHRIHARLEGRREVWLRIQQHLNLPPDQLWKLFNPNVPLHEDMGI